MTYAKPQIIASYSLDSAVGDVRAACSNSGVPAGDVFVDVGSDCGYVSSPTINGNLFSGHWHAF